MSADKEGQPRPKIEFDFELREGERIVVDQGGTMHAVRLLRQ